MNILILGAGEVGSSLSELLSAEPEHDITLVDLDATRLQKLQDHLDIRTVTGHASDPGVLEEAGLETADMLIAVTQSDETNIVACHMAHTLHHTQTKIARVRKTAYLTRPELFNRKLHDDAFAVDVLISPERLVTEHILKLVHYPGALQVADFAQDKIRLVGFRIYSKHPIAGCAIRELKDRLPGIETRILAVFRKNELIVPNGETELRPNDIVFFLARTEEMEKLAETLRLRRHRHTTNRIMIAGGGNIGLALARTLEQHYSVKIVEHNLARARLLAENLNQAIVIHGDITDKSLLEDENIDEIGLFIAITNRDEANIISSLLAKKLGVKRVIALINNQSYVDLLHLNQIDVAISADRITTNHLLHYLRRGDTVRAYSLRQSEAEALEIAIHGSPDTHPVIGKRLIDIEWPEGVVIGCIVRDLEILFARKDLVLMDNDHIILMAANRETREQLHALLTPELKKHWWSF